MPDLNVSLWAVDPTTGALTALPDYTSLTISPQRNSAGTINVVYPETGINFPTLRGMVTADRDLEVEIWLSGTSTGAIRGYLQEASGDDVAETGTWTFAGGGLELRMAEAVIYPQAVDSANGNSKQELVFNAATPGGMISTLLTQAQGRGTLTDVTKDFSNSVDSRGVAWPNVISTKFSPGANYDQVLAKLVDLGLAEWAMQWNGTSHVLRMWAPQGRGTDRTTGGTPVILQAGRNLVDAPRKWSVRASGTAVLASGAEGVYQTASDASAQSRRGRRIETSTSANNLTTSSAVLAYAQTQLATVTPGILQVTHGLGFLDNEPRPGLSFDIGDWVNSRTGATLDRLRVVEWSLTVDGDQNPSGTVTLNDALTETIIRLQDRLQAITAGETVVGTSTTSGVDGGVPTPPSGVVVSSLAYVQGIDVIASVTVGWVPPTLNTDGSTITDLAGYQIQFSTGTGPYFPATIVPNASATSGSFTATPGQTIHVQVRAYDQAGNASAWSSPAIDHTTATDVTPPPVPSTPVVSNYLGVLKIAWDGKTDTGADMYAAAPDFHHVEVYVSTASAFTPDATTLFDRLYAFGSVVYTDGVYGTTYYAKFISVDGSNNKSAASAQGSDIPLKVVGPDLADGLITAAKLFDGAVTTTKIAPLAVTGPAIASDAITADKIAANAVTASEIAANAVTAGKIAAGSISTSHLTVAAFGDNEAPNGGFEDADLTDPTQPAKWTVLADAGTSVALDTTVANVYSGTTAAQVTLTAGAARHIELRSAWVPTRPGELWFLEIAAKASRVYTGLTVTIDYNSGADPTVGTPTNDVRVLDAAFATSYAVGEYNSTAPATVGGQPTKWVRFKAEGRNNDSAALTVWFDEVRARKVTGTAEIADASINTAKIANLAVQDANVANMNVGKLTAGTLSVAVTNAGIIRSGTTGQRYELDAAGFRLYNAASTQTVGFNGTTNFVTGEFRTALTGQRVVFNPGGSLPDTINLYPTGGGDFARVMARTAPADGSAAILIDGGAATGVGRGRLGAYKGEAFVSWVTNDVGGDTSAGFSRTAVSCGSSAINTWAQTKFLFNQYSGSSLVSNSQAWVMWANGSITSCPVFGANAQDSGIKLDGGTTCATNAIGTLFGPMKATAFTVASSGDVKTDIMPVKQLFTPLDVVAAAPARAYKYIDEVSQHGDAAPMHFGPIAEDLPADLVRWTPAADGSGLEKSVDVMAIAGTLWSMVGQLLARRITSTTATCVVPVGTTIATGASVEVPCAWESSPLATPTDAIVFVNAGLLGAGKVTAWVKPGSITPTGCTVVFRNTSSAPVKALANALAGLTNITATVVGQALYTPPTADY